MLYKWNQYVIFWIGFFPLSQHYLTFPLLNVPHLFVFILLGSVYFCKSCELFFGVKQDVSQSAHPSPEAALEPPCLCQSPAPLHYTLPGYPSAPT